MAQLSNRLASLHLLVARVQALSESVASWAKRIGIAALGAGAIAWLTLFGRWVFDSVPAFVLTAIIAVLLAVPGLLLFNFSVALRHTIDTSNTILSDVQQLAVEGGREVVAGVSDTIRQPGAGKGVALLGALWRLNDFRGDFGQIVGRLVGSARLISPLYLLSVAAAILGTILIGLLAVVGLLVWAF